MPTLPLAPGDVLNSGDLPVRDVDDVKAILPQPYAGPETAVVRDALCDGITAGQQEWQARAGYAAAQADIGRSTEEFLQGLANDRGFAKIEGETNTALRTRVLAVPDLVSPENIIAAVKALLAPFTSIEPQYMESVLDRFFITDGTLDWHSFIGQSPSYPTRFYTDDEPQNGNKSIPNRSPGGARIFQDSIGRHFIIRVPDISPIDEARAAVFDGTQVADEDLGLFVGDGTSALNSSFIGGNVPTAQTLYQSIVDKVEAIHGHSVRWQLFIDPELT